VSAIFKNEAMILREWIEHCKKRGANHIYLIDDQSDDDYMSILEPYIKENYITLFHFHEPKYLGRQRSAYNAFLLPILRDTQWLAVLDIDEFLWSPRSVDLRPLLRQCLNIPQIQICVTRFGSNGFEKQPECIVNAFTRREVENVGCRKVIINSNYRFSSINIHHSTCIDNEEIVLLDWNSDLKNPYFLINHYCVQSMEYWEKIKMTRGDADGYQKEDARDWDYFWRENKNDVEDLRLVKQNLENSRS
jgi:hypothetical protein